MKCAVWPPPSCRSASVEIRRPRTGRGQSCLLLESLTDAVNDLLLFLFVHHSNDFGAP